MLCPVPLRFPVAATTCFSRTPGLENGANHSGDGSLVVVFFGMALISVLISAIELTWRWLVSDRALIAMGGFYLALVVMQLSGGLL